MDKDLNEFLGLVGSNAPNRNCEITWYTGGDPTREFPACGKPAFAKVHVEFMNGTSYNRALWTCRECLASLKRTPYLKR